MSDIAERIKKIVIEHLDVEADKVTEGASFIDDLGADSLDNVELVMAFEEEFGVEIPDDAAEHIQTVGDAIKFVEKATAERRRTRPGKRGRGTVSLAIPMQAGGRRAACLFLKCEPLRKSAVSTDQ